jgi:hypothetical protein
VVWTPARTRVVWGGAGPAAAGDGDDGVEGGAASRPSGARVGGGRRRLGPIGDGC